jgi:murein DD-endopeptidase MepM/ murein hydrolase activator NlpD
MENYLSLGSEFLRWIHKKIISLKKEDIKKISLHLFVLAFLFFLVEPLVAPNLVRQNQNALAGKGNKPVIKKIVSSYVALANFTDNSTFVNSTYVWPVRGNITQVYYPWHQGLDIALPTGYSCVAAKAGVIEFAGWSTGYGYNVLINHGDGSKTRYAHFSRISVVGGQTVSQGQEVGKIGSTGWSTGPHLHFEIIENGYFVDPLRRLN